MVDVICDTSFLIHLATRNIKNLDSIYSEIGNIEFVIPLVVLNELEQLTKNQNKQADASKTLEFVRDMKNIEISGKFADNAISEYIQKHGMKCKIINKVSSGSPHIVDVLDSKKIALVINTGGGNSEHRLSDAIALRRATLKNKVPYCTNMSTAQACLEAIRSLKTKKLEVTSLQDI